MSALSSVVSQIPVLAFELQWADFTFAAVVLAWLTVLLYGSKYVEYMWIGALGKRPFRLFVAPGVIVHEYSHALACLLTGAKIHEIKLFKSDGGHVKHDRPRATLLGLPFLMPKREESRGMMNLLRWRFLSSFFISFAPVVGCLLCIWLLSLVMVAVTGKSVMSAGEEPTTVSNSDPSPGPAKPAAANQPANANSAANKNAANANANGSAGAANANAPKTNAPATNAAPITGDTKVSDIVDAAAAEQQKKIVADGGDIARFGVRVWNSLINIGAPIIHSLPIGIIYIWLLLSFTVCMAPSERDFSNSIVGILVLLVVLIVVSIALERSEANALPRVISAIIPLASYTTAVMIFALAASSVVAPTIRAITRGR